MIGRRRRTAADFHALRVANDHSASLARQLAEAHETIRRQARALDVVKYDRRDLAARLANARAQLAVLAVKSGADQA